MKASFIAVLGLALLPPLCYSQSTPASPQQLEQLERQFRPREALSPDFVQKYVAADYVWTMPGAELGRSDLTKGFPGETVYENKIQDLNVRVIGETGVASGHMTKRAKEASDGLVHDWKVFFQDVWVKQDGAWKLIATASSARSTNTSPAEGNRR